MTTKGFTNNIPIVPANQTGNGDLVQSYIEDLTDGKQPDLNELQKVIGEFDTPVDFAFFLGELFALGLVGRGSISNVGEFTIGEVQEFTNGEMEQIELMLDTSPADRLRTALQMRAADKTERIDTLAPARSALDNLGILGGEIRTYEERLDSVIAGGTSGIAEIAENLINTSDPLERSLAYAALLSLGQEAAETVYEHALRIENNPSSRSVGEYLRWNLESADSGSYDYAEAKAHEERANLSTGWVDYALEHSDTTHDSEGSNWKGTDFHPKNTSNDRQTEKSYSLRTLTTTAYVLCKSVIQKT